MPLSHQSLIAHRSLFNSFLFNTTYFFAADFDWLLTILESGIHIQALRLHSPLVNMALSGMSSSLRHRHSIQAEFLSILTQHNFPFYLRVPLILSHFNH